MAKTTKKIQRLNTAECLRPQKGVSHSWLIFLAYLAYLRAMRPQQSPETKVLRTLIIVVGLVLVIVALVAAGAPEVVTDVLKHWPSLI